MSKGTQHVDVLIVGGGPIGLACAIEAVKSQLSYVVIEKGSLVNSILNYPLGMTFFSTAERLEIGNVPFISNNHKPVRSEALEYYRRVMLMWNLNIRLYETVNEIQAVPSGFQVHTSKSGYSAGAVIIATGFYDIPQKLNIEGAQLSKVHHYYKEPHPYSSCKVVVIGAANSAVDAALECYRKGAEVTMVVRQSAISERVKYWVRPDIENRIKEKSIQAFFNSEIRKITLDTVIFKTPAGEIEVLNDFVLAMTGYLPDFDFLNRSGVSLAEDGCATPTYNAETMETNVPDLYLAGVVCGGKNTHLWFIENSRVHASIILKSILHKRVISGKRNQISDYGNS